MENPQNLFDNIIFIGGVHGVGKSTVCNKLAAHLKISYLSASDVLKWKDINVDVRNKLVTNIPDMQDRLIKGLQGIIEPNRYHILDGHYCLFNKEGVATKVPFSIFEVINPMYFVIIIGDAIKISEALKTRDQKIYSEESLVYMQTMELEYAKEIAQKLKTQLFVFDINQYDLNYNNLLSQLHESLA